MNLITSRDNPLVKTLRRLAQESNAYRKLEINNRRQLAGALTPSP